MECNVSLSDIIERKFVESIVIDDWEIETDTGWESVSAIHKTVEYQEYILRLSNGMELICADTHIVFRADELEEVFVKDLVPGDMVLTKDGPVGVIDVLVTEQYSNMYDITVDSPNHRFYTNGILSHNTTTATVMILHYILFNKEKTVGILANKADTSREILDRIQFAYQELPKWLQQGVLEWNKGSLKLENGCKVIASSSSSSAIRGKSCSFLYIDECAFLENWQEFYSSVYPTISSGKETKILLTSTPRRMNHFYKLCEEAKDLIDENSDVGKNGFIYHEVKWDRIPERDEAWKIAEIASMGGNIDQFVQEYECGFMGSTDNLISTSALQNLVAKKPVLQADHLRQYERPIPSHSYVLVADVSRGKSLDYSAFSIFDVTQMPYKQVCTYNNNEIGPIDYSVIINNIAKSYNNAMVLVEVNDIGGQVADCLYLDLGYENILSTQTNGRSGKRISGGFGRNVDRGIRTSAKVKLIGCSVVKLLIEQNQLLIHDDNTIEQLKVFVKRADSYEAEKGHHDDLVMTLVLFAWLSDQMYFKEMTDINTLGKLRDNTDEDLYSMTLPFFYSDSDDPFGRSVWEIVG